MIQTILLDWNDAVGRQGVALDELALRLGRLTQLGVDVVLHATDERGGLDEGVPLRPLGPGRLFVWWDRPPQCFRIEARNGTSIWAPVPLTSTGQPSSNGPAPPVAPADVLAWVRTSFDSSPANLLTTGGAGNRPDDLLAALDDVIAAHDAFPEAADDPTWRIEVEGFDPDREQQVESWLTVANGRTGTRGSIEEAGHDSSPALFVAGFFGDVGEPLPGRDLVCGPEWTTLQPRTPTDEVQLRKGETLEHRRVLDMRQGILFRQWRQHLPSGGDWQFRSARFASLADRSVLCLEAEAQCSGMPISLADRMPLAPAQPALASIDARREGDLALVYQRAKGGGIVTSAVSTTQAEGKLRRLMVLHRSGDDGPGVDAGMAVARSTGISVLRARHRKAWSSRWRDADVVVSGDAGLQRAVRFALYHLISSGDPESDLASIGARGLTGPGYRAHVFWDTDVFVLPFFIWTHPPTARALLAYRYRTLPAARAKASRFGYSGALYAWESADTGDETTPPFGSLPDGTPIPILTGVQEQHISADVAWAAWQYWRVTGDDDFLAEMGAELIVETARFWASRAEDGSDGRLHITGVIGPDEYHESVDDNVFTNVMARWNLRTAAEVCDRLATLDPSGWSKLQLRLALDGGEVSRWRAVADALVDNFDPDSLVYEQFNGFRQLEETRAAELAPRPFGGDSLLGVEHVRRTQVVKQADVLMLPLTLPDVAPADVWRANYEFYEPRTSHGSSLSPAVHAAVAARVGAVDDADAYFRLAAGIDLDNRMGNASQGVHIATMGGLWQAAVMGFGGVRAEADALRIDPHAPTTWKGLSFPVRWHGTRVQVDVVPDTLRLRLEGPATVGVGTAPASRLESGRFVARRQGDGWGPLQPA